jgi:hypothetical protein
MSNNSENIFFKDPGKSLPRKNVIALAFLNQI